MGTSNKLSRHNNQHKQKNPASVRYQDTKGMFSNYFFPLFFVFKNNFLFLRLKNLFGNSKWAGNKNCFQNSIYEGN